MDKLNFKHITILITLLIIGTIIYIMFSSGIRNKISDNEKEKVIKEYKEKQELVISDSSNIDTILDLEKDTNIISTLEYDEKQIYFKDAEILYDFYSFNEVDKIKIKIQDFIHSYIDSNILDCSIVKDSIYKNDKKISFNILLENENVISIETLKNEDILNINIQYN